MTKSGFGAWSDTKLDEAVSDIKDEVDTDFERSVSELF